jgi:RNA recognition motif-containing protein
MAAWRQDNPPVAPEPKLFVGQIPFEVTTPDVQTLFSRYGTVKSALVISGSDGRSKGCAMVLFDTWGQAEAAQLALNGTTALGGQKAMVVKFADPPKRGDGPVIGIAQRKLFVGQVTGVRFVCIVPCTSLCSLTCTLRSSALWGGVRRLLTLAQWLMGEVIACVGSTSVTTGSTGKLRQAQ